MEAKDLAAFYNISAQAVGRWSVEKRKQKTVQALANAEQQIVDLIGDISKLVFIFNCKWLHGEKQVKCQILEVTHNNIMVDGTEIWDSANTYWPDAVQHLQSIKTKLEVLVYGVSSVD